jgi:hypothetical protein
MGRRLRANKTLASRAVQAFGEVKSHPEVVEFFDKTMVNGQKLGDHPVMVRMLGNIGGAWARANSSARSRFAISAERRGLPDRHRG